MELKLISQTSLPAAIIGTSYKQFSLLVQAWKKLHVRRISWKGQDVSNNIWVHVVKQGETITSISKLNGLPILEIIAAANKDIVDLDLVFEGHRVNIPPTNDEVSQKCHLDRDKSNHKLPKSAAAASGLRFLGGKWGQMINVALPPQLSRVKAKISSVIVLVPLIALCIRFVMCALRDRAARNSRHRFRSESNLGRPVNERWRTVLGDAKGTDERDFESQPEDSEGEGPSEERDRTHYEDHPHHAHAKLESDYRKFLNECGMSKYGYFRGGSPE